MKEYVENMKKYEGNMTNEINRSQDLEKFRAFQQEGGDESYADADIIPEMTPSTEREDGSPAKSARYTLCVQYHAEPRGVVGLQDLNALRQEWYANRENKKQYNSLN